MLCLFVLPEFFRNRRIFIPQVQIFVRGSRYIPGMLLTVHIDGGILRFLADLKFEFSILVSVYFQFVQAERSCCVLRTLLLSVRILRIRIADLLDVKRMLLPQILHG